MNPKQIIFLSLLYVGTGLAVAYFAYKLGWNGGGGSGVPDTTRPQPVLPTMPAGLKPTGGYIPGRIGNKVEYN
jgi:hypothetical protein